MIVILPATIDFLIISADMDLSTKSTVGRMQYIDALNAIPFEIMAIADTEDVDAGTGSR